MLYILFAALLLFFIIYTLITHNRDKQRREMELERIQRRLAEKEAEAKEQNSSK